MLAGVTDALECGAAFGVGLPALESADVKLAVAGIESGAHAAALKVPGEAGGAALDLAVYFFVEDVEEGGLAVGEIEKLAFGLAPFIAGDEDGIAAGVVPAWIDEPAEGIVGDDGKGGDVGEFGHAAEHAGLDPVKAVFRDPGALVVAGDGLAVFADAHAVGGAEAGGDDFEFAAVLGDFHQGAMVAGDGELEAPPAGVYAAAFDDVEVACGVLSAGRRRTRGSDRSWRRRC